MSSSTKTTTSTPSYSADQSDIQSQLAAYLKTNLGTTAQTDPIKAQAVGQVNRNYGSLQDRLSQNFSARGFGNSGTAALSTAQTEIARQSDLGGIEGQFAQLNLDQQNKTASLAEMFGFQNPTTTTTQKTSGGVLNGLLSSAGLIFGLATGGSGGGDGGGGLFSGLNNLFSRGGGTTTPTGGTDYQNYA